MKGWLKRLMVFITTGRYSLFGIIKSNEIRKVSMENTDRLAAELSRMRRETIDGIIDPAITITKALNGNGANN